MIVRDSRHDAGHSSFNSYLIGFIGSVLLTLLAYGATVYELLSGWPLLLTLAGLALAQLAVQLWFFLHLNKEGQPRWNLLVFSFMTLIVAILVVGSLWIMTHLNYHMHDSPQQLDQSIIKDEGIHHK